MFDCGPFVLDCESTKTVNFLDDSPGLNEDVMGHHQVFLVDGPEGIRVELSYTTLETGERLVQALDSSGYRPFEYLAGGSKRMMVENVEDKSRAKVALKQAYLPPDDRRERPRHHSPTLDELNEGAQLDVAELLVSAGADEVNTKEVLGLMSGPDDKTRNLICAIFHTDHTQVPLAAYTATRILPLYYRYCPKEKSQKRLF